MCDLTLFITGRSMGNLATCYSELGRHQEALVLNEEALKFNLRVLPENHPDLDDSYAKVCLSYLRYPHYFHRAIEKARESLRIAQANLPPSHPRIFKIQGFVSIIEMVKEPPQDDWDCDNPCFRFSTT